MGKSNTYGWRKKHNQFNQSERPETCRQDDLKWRSIVFLPFNFFWRLFLGISGVIYFNLIIYEQIFTSDHQTTSDSVERKILKSFTFAYSIDIILSILHKTWESIQKSMPYEPKGFGVIILDIISILPFQYFMDEPVLSKHGINWLQILSMNGCLRIYKIFVELIYLQHRMDMNPIIVTIIQQNAFAFSLASLFSSILYTCGYIHYNEVSWFHELENRTTINHENPFSMLQFCFVFVYASMSHDVVTDVLPVRDSELFIMAVIKFVGYLLLIFTVSNTIESFVKFQCHLYRIKSQIVINLKSLKGKKLKEIKNYYRLFWNNWSCIEKCPLLSHFPLCLQKDVLTDVYWDAITHSHILRNFNLNIQRQLSLVMKSKFLQPGENLFKKHEWKNCYYHIATGVVQVMSLYDGISPIMTLSGGSCIGDSSLILRTPCLTDVVCASVCEVRFLSYKDFYKVLVTYPSGMKLLHEITANHLEFVKRMYFLAEHCRDNDYVMKLYNVPQHNSLKWVKQRWRALYNAEIELLEFSEKTVRKIKEEINIDVTHTSKFLDLIVLHEDESWQSDKCCIKSSCSFVFDPDCNFLKIWLTSMFIITTIDCIIVPYRAAFMIDTTDRQVVWDHIVCIAYMLDLYFQAITGVRSVELTVMEPMRLLRHHLKNPRFLIDILGSLPARELARFVTPESKISPNAALNRLLKLWRAIMYFKYRHGIIMANNLVTLISKCIYIYGFITYFAICFAFLTACQYDEINLVMKCNEKSWFAVNYLAGKNFPDVLNKDTILSFSKGLAQSFYDSLFYVIRFMLKSGLKGVTSISLNDTLLLTLYLFIANNLLIMTISEVTATWIFRRQRRVACKYLINDLKVFLSDKNIHVGLHNMLESFINVQWKVNEFIEGNLDATMPPEEIISPILHAENANTISSSLKTIPFFDSLTDDTFSNICKAFRLFTVPENFIFCRSGSQPTSFNIIINGHCRLTSMLKQDIITHPEGTVIDPGDYFPLMEVVQNKTCLQTTVSITVCEVAAIDAIELRQLLFRDTIITRQIIHANVFKVKDIDIIESKIKYLRRDNIRCPNFVSSRKRKRNANNPYLLKFLLQYVSMVWNPPFIIHPNGQFLFIWETIKVLQVTSSILYSSVVHSVNSGGNGFFFYIPVVLDIFSFLDVLLRFNVGHYNKLGVLGNSHKFYITHSFSTDFISTLPVDLIFDEYSSKLRFFLCVFCKSLQLYRISGYLNMMEKQFQIEKFKLYFLSSLIHFILVFTVLGSCLFRHSCDVYTKNNGVSEAICANNSWISTNERLKESSEFENPVFLLLFSFNMVLTVFLGNDQKAFNIHDNEIQLMAFFAITALFFKYFYTSKAVGLLFGGYLNFSKHRENMGLYWGFVKNEGGSTKLASVIASHFTFAYQKLRGIKIIEIVGSLHPSLQCDLTFALYYGGMLCLHKYVGKSKSLMKHLTKKVDEIYYEKGSILLDIDEINDEIYFILEGFISVLNNEDECIKMLNPGSMFGSLKPHGSTRHKKKFASQVHVNLLRIKSVKFFIILRDYGKRHEKKFLKKTLNKEYIAYRKKETRVDIQRQNLDNTMVPLLNTEEITLDYQRIPWLNRDLAWYKWTIYILSMITPYLSAISTLSTIVENKHNKLMFMIIYALDIASLFRIILFLFTKYTDERTGIFISDLSRIRKDYIKTPFGFFIDLISCIPFELIYYVVTRTWLKELYINRLVRLVVMCRFVSFHKNKIYIRPWLRWFEFIAYFTLLPFIFICTWQYLMCGQGCAELTATTTPLIASVYEVLSLVTFSPSYNLKKPSNYKECLSIITFSMAAFFLAPTIIGCYSQISELGRYTKKCFVYNTGCMKIFLQLRDLSDSLLVSLWNYSLLLWHSDSGELLPFYINNAPAHMKNELLYDLFGAHLKYNTLFEMCSIKFISQLSGRFRRTIYFPGDFIIRKYDIDNRMYFINSGEVDSIEYGELNQEIVIQVLITGNCFGLEQGLYDCTAHMSTYKARSMVEILTLEKSDWQDLAIAFPEARNIIYKTAEAIDVISHHQHTQEYS